MNYRRFLDVLMLVAFIVSLIVLALFLYDFFLGKGDVRENLISITTASGFVTYYCFCYYYRSKEER